MLFRQLELLRWLGVSVFEIWIWLVSLLVFSVLLTLKVEDVLSSSSWFLVFAPLFISDGINAYFCIIVFIRQYLYQEFKNAPPLRALWSLLVIGMCFESSILNLLRVLYRSGHIIVENCVVW
jgi:hypothetical protein